MLKNTVLSLAAVVATTFVAVACDTGTNIEACTAENEAEKCTADQICSIPEGETEGSCITPECENDTDCDLQNDGVGSPIYSTDDITSPATTCEDEDAVTIVGFDGIERCAIDPDGVDCEEIAAGSVETEAELASGGSVTICALEDGVCNIDTAQCE
ncbi:MAG TPA: hypothetical protein VGF99_02825 [Myxococcota bacterium]